MTSRSERAKFLVAGWGVRSILGLLSLSVAGCHHAPPPPAPPAEVGTAYIRLINLSHHPADFRLDGILAAKGVRPGESSPFCILSAKLHQVDATSDGGGLASQPVAMIAGVNYSLVVTDSGSFGPQVVSGEDREPVPGMACIQALSLAGRTATLTIGSTAIPMGVKNVAGARTMISPGSFTWFSGGISGPARLEPGACYTIFVGDHPGTLWFRTEVHRKPQSLPEP